VSGFDVFQLAAVLLFCVILTVKIAVTARSTGRSPVTIGRHKQPAETAAECAFPAIAAVSLVTVAVRALRVQDSLMQWGASHLGLPAWLVETVRLAFRSAWPAVPAANWVGAAFIVAGFVILISAYWTIGHSWRVGTDIRAPGPLVTRGIYRISRNPIYLFFHLYLLGSVLITGSIIVLACLLCQIVTVHWLIRYEERSLARIHGSRYVAYRRRTGRYWTVRCHDAGAEPGC